MFWFFTPPFWMDDIQTGHCDRGDGFADIGWNYENNVEIQYARGGTGKMSVATFDGAEHDMDTLYYGDSRRNHVDHNGNGYGGGWPSSQ